MKRTQILLPDALYRRANRFAARRELTMAELMRMGLELMLTRAPAISQPEARWQMPRVDGGGLKVPLVRIREALADEGSVRGLPRR